MDYKDLVQKRRSHRKFTEQPIDGDDVKLILRAGLMSPTSKSCRAWHFIVVEDPQKIQQISEAKELGGAFLKGAPLLIVVTGPASENDCWIEDGSIAAFSMQMQAEDLGLGSCWAQMRNRGLTDGTSATTVIQGILGLPEEQLVLCVLGIGHASDERKLQDEEKLRWEHVHIDQW